MCVRDGSRFFLRWSITWIYVIMLQGIGRYSVFKRCIDCCRTFLRVIYHRQLYLIKRMSNFIFVTTDLYTKSISFRRKYNICVYIIYSFRYYKIWPFFRSRLSRNNFIWVLILVLYRYVTLQYQKCFHNQNEVETIVVYIFTYRIWYNSSYTTSRGSAQDFPTGRL